MTDVALADTAAAPKPPQIQISLPNTKPLLSARLSVDYPTRPGILRDVVFHVNQGEVLGLVGLSGAGKSTLAQAILQILQAKGAVVRGELNFQGENLLAFGEGRRRSIRGRRIALIPQSPIASLNPALPLISQFREAWRAHSRVPFAQAMPRVHQLLRQVSLPDTPEFLRSYPGALSVGLAQRVLIALAMLHSPALVIGDEPTSALDVITQAEILNLFRDLNRSTGMAMLYISHDLLSVAQLCHRVAVLYQGSLVETGPTEQIFRNPQHGYTRKLVSSIPNLAFPRA